MDNTYDNKRTNPPTTWQSTDLAVLYHALTAYQGQDTFAHPYQQKSDDTHEISAGVLVLLTNEPCPRLLLTKRSHQLSAHAGEVSFVGGRRDTGDKDVAETALREAYEEVGLSKERVSIIGYLPCQTAKSGAVVRPVVAVVSSDVCDDLVGCQEEIERIFWGELAFFKTTPPTDIQLTYDNYRFATPAWTVDGETVWGLTGRIIANLLEIGFGVVYEWYYRSPKDQHFP